MNILVTKSNSSVAMGVIKSIPKEHNIISVGFDEYSPVGNFVNKSFPDLAPKLTTRSLNNEPDKYIVFNI